MIAEMTRAFNVGFGLGVHGIGGTPTSGSNSQAEGTTEDSLPVGLESWYK